MEINYEETYEIFNGRKLTDDFFNDIKHFLSFDLKFKKEIISKTIKWYPRPEISEDWEKWNERIDDSIKRKVYGSLSAILFLLKQYFLKRFSKNDFFNELIKLGFEDELINYFYNKIKRNKTKLLEKVQCIEVPVLGKLLDLKWRIDIKKHGKYHHEYDDICAIMKFDVMLSNKKEEEFIIELTLDEINSLRRTFNFIAKDIKDIKDIGK